MASVGVQRRKYVQEWATKAHRNPSDVYVPESLQPSVCFSCGWTRETITATSDVDGPGNHRGCKEGRW